MNGRHNPHRVQHWQLAERQRYLTELESLGIRLRADAGRLDDEIAQAGGGEAVLGNSRIDPLFVRPLIDRRDKLQRSIAEVEVQIAEARSAVTSSQQEIKLVEGSLAPRGLRFEDRLTRRARRSI
ncbi:MAG TPA: hypothetical protein VMB84_17940 [Stellaceae bacterium]|nr:hypothetical protein [Stellaceae bacterium]